ncbi:MAG: lysoplasmalogenase [Treponema sp.]|jgi:uncharacterized membrane protein YhhN|nr:lysoplasmalogenase [Treponema sp.]
MVNILYTAYAAAAAVNLAAILLEKPAAPAANPAFLLRAASKIALMPLLGAVYAMSALSPSVLVFAALGAGWLGDIFLIRPKGRAAFTMGLVCFLAGHLCYITRIALLTEHLALVPLVISAAVSVPLILGAQRVIRPPADMRVPVLTYSAVLCGLCAAALQLLCARWNFSAGLVFAGGVSFVISDTVLGVFAFGRTPRFGNIAIMTPYIAAQAAIVSGLAALQ